MSSLSSTSTSPARLRKAQALSKHNSPLHIFRQVEAAEIDAGAKGAGCKGVKHASIAALLRLLMDLLGWAESHSKREALDTDAYLAQSQSEALNLLALHTLGNRARLRFNELKQTRQSSWSAQQCEAWENAFNSFANCIDVPSCFIPSMKQAERIISFVGESTLFDAGAGSAFVTQVLRCSGVNVRAVDNCVIEHNRQHIVDEVDMLDALMQHEDDVNKDRVVLAFFCPDPAQERVTQTVQWFHQHGGRRVVTAGRSAANAAPSFWKYLRTYFTRVETVNNIRVMAQVSRLPLLNPSTSSKTKEIPVPQVFAMPLFVWQRNEMKTVPPPDSPDALDLTRAPTSSASLDQQRARDGLDLMKTLCKMME